MNKTDVTIYLLKFALETLEANGLENTRNKDNWVICRDIETHLENLAKVVKADEEVSNSSLVMATYRFPDGNIATFGYDDQQIPELQGVYSDELRDKIKQRSDNRTSWNGF